MEGGDAMRRLEARHEGCWGTIPRVLLALRDFVDQKSVAAGREDVVESLVVLGKTRHQGKHLAL